MNPSTPRAHPDEADYASRRTRTNSTTLRAHTVDQFEISDAHGAPGRTDESELTNYPHSAPGRTRRTHTNPATHRAHLDEPERTHRPLGRTRTNQTKPNEPSDTHVHTNELDEPNRTQRPRRRTRTNLTNGYELSNRHSTPGRNLKEHRDPYGVPGRTRRTQTDPATTKAYQDE